MSDNKYISKLSKKKTARILAWVGIIIIIALIIATFITGQMLLFFCGVLGVFVTISLAQTFGIYEEEKPTEIPPEYAKAPKKASGFKASNSKNEDEYVDELDAEYMAIEQEQRQLPEMRQPQDYDKVVEEEMLARQMEEARYSFDEEAPEAEAEEVIIEDKKKKKEKKKKEKKQKIKKQKETKEEKVQEDSEDLFEAKDDFEEINIMDIVSDNKQEDELAEETEESHIPTEEVIVSYDKKKIKKTMHRYKVKRDHRMALVDRCDKLNIHQTPAYIWVADNKFHMLLIEKEPRYLTFPIYNLTQITYLKKQPSNPDVDYALLKNNSIMAELFKPYLPNYAHSTVVDDLTSYKNLYGIGPGIYFTNHSARHLFDLLGSEFIVEDKVTTSNKVNYYFKDAYKANILLRDEIIDANGYADKISDILEGMAMSTISHNEFKDTLNLMIKNKLITQEFAMYYMDMRNKKQP